MAGAKKQERPTGLRICIKGVNPDRISSTKGITTEEGRE